jgi:hypothetical protein
MDNELGRRRGSFVQRKPRCRDLPAGCDHVVIGSLDISRIQEPPAKQNCCSLGILAPMIFAHFIFLSGTAVCITTLHNPAIVLDKFAFYQVGTFQDGTARFASLSGALPDGQVFVSPMDLLLLLQIRSAAGEPMHIRATRLTRIWAASGSPFVACNLLPIRPIISRHVRSRAR